MKQEKKKQFKPSKMPKNILVFLSVVVFLFAGMFIAHQLLNKDGEFNLSDALDGVSDKQDIAAFNPIDVEGMNQAILAYFEEEGIDSDDISISYYNFATEDVYALNDDETMFAASTYKVPLNMLIYDKYRDNVDTSLSYCYSCYSGDGGSVEVEYYMGEKVPLSQLQYESILNSDNTSSMIMFEDLGGWDAFIEMTSQYVGREVTGISYENSYKAKDMIEVLKYLYNHEDDYSELLSNMKEARVGEYLEKYISHTVAHKYGEFEDVQNDVGIVYASKPYAIAVYTANQYDGEDVIARINKIISEYTDNA